MIIYLRIKALQLWIKVMGFLVSKIDTSTQEGKSLYKEGTQFLLEAQMTINYLQKGRVWTG